jgi:hypothetical protein
MKKIFLILLVITFCLEAKIIDLTPKGSGSSSGGAGDASAANQTSVQSTAGSDATKAISIQGITNGKAIKVDGSASVQPISAAALPLPTGASSAANQVSGNASLTSIDAKLSGTLKNQSKPNVVMILRDVFESFIDGDKWSLSKSSGDIVQVDGNAVASSYLVLSLDPLTAGSSTYIDSIATFNAPVESHMGLHMSQRVVGQEASVEFISTETPISSFAEVAISSISQSTTTLTINTATAHNLVPGKRIGIYGVSDSRFNYSELVVASIPSTTQFTATAGPMGTIPSVTAGPFTSGYVYFRPALSYAPNGSSMIFENSTVTNASFYSRANAGDALASGTLVGNHSATISSTASNQTVVTDYTYSFQPTSEFRFTHFEDQTQWSDGAVDSASGYTARFKKTLVTPDPTKIYKLRFKVTNQKGLTIPVAQIVSAVKTGTTTATVITNVAHGLSTGDYINTFGVRDTTNFANLTTATVVASVVNSTTFTVVWGSAVTATSYGGYVSRVQGGQVQQGALTMVAQSVSRTSNVVSLIGSASWSGAVVGDYVNLVGIRDNSTGASLGVDGPYRIRKIATTTLELDPIGSAPTGSDIASTNCGGGVIKRTDLRITFVKVQDFDRERVEILNRPLSDLSNATGVIVNNTPSVSVSNTPSVTVSSGTVTTVSTVSAVTAANLNFPQTIADVASAAITATATTSAFTPTFGSAYQINIPVTAFTGTSLDIVVQESDDGGTNWFDVYHFPRITATGMYRSPVLPLVGNRIRYVQTMVGTTITRAINRLQSSWNGASLVRQLFDRSITLTTLSSTTSALSIDGCRNLQLTINLGAATTAPTLQLQISEDGTNYVNVGSTLVGVASSTVTTTLANINAKFVRAIVTSAGATVTAGFVQIKAWQ